MAFEDIEVSRPQKASALGVPSDGVCVKARKLGRKGGGESRYIQVTIGATLARSISLTQPEHGIKMMFGTGVDAGKVMVSVDNQDGKFRARQSKHGAYALTVNAPTAAGLFSLDFPAFTRSRLEALRPVNGQPAHFVFTASAEMLAADD